MSPHCNDDNAVQRKEVLRQLYMATVLCSCFIVVEVVGGLILGSLAILSDATHLFVDLTNFAVAIGASYLSSLPAMAQHIFGLKPTSESLAALFNMVSLAFVSVGLAYEAVKRLISPPEEGVNGSIMTLIAGTGVLVNLVLAWVLGDNHVHLPGGDHGHDHSQDHGGHDSHNHAHGHDHDNQKYGHGLHDGAE